MLAMDILRVPRQLAVPAARRWCSDAAAKRREEKAALKRREMLRKRDTSFQTPTMRAGMNLAKAEASGQAPSKSALGVIRKIGFKNWWQIVWLGNRSRGGGLKATLQATVSMVSFFVFGFFPLVYFFYDDGRAALDTRLLTTRQFKDTKDARVLDVGVGNGELTRMLALELRDIGGTIHGLDLDTENVRQLTESFKHKRLRNVEFEAIDVLDLPRKHADRRYTHVLLSMCLHELDPVRRVSILETSACMAAGGKIVIMDFTEAAGGWSNISMVRNNIFEALSGHYEYFRSWTATGGLSPLIDAMNEEREKGNLKMPPLKLAETFEEDRGTHAVYVVDVGTMGDAPAGGDAGAANEKKSFLSKLFGR